MLVVCCITLAVGMVCGSFSANAAETAEEIAGAVVETEVSGETLDSGGFTFNLSSYDKTATITDFSQKVYAARGNTNYKTDHILNIPSEVEGNDGTKYPVTEIRIVNWKDEKENLTFTKVTIPKTIIDIHSTFSEIESLKYVDFEEGSAMGQLPSGCFKNCVNLERIGVGNTDKLPESITRIEGQSFNGCKSLKSITLPEGLTYLGSDFYVSDRYCFNECVSLKSMVIPASVNGIAPTTIASSAFASCGLNSVVIPDTVTSIGYAAFYSNNLRSVTLPSHLTSIGQEAFRNNYLSSINIPNTVTNIGIAAFACNCFPTGSDLFYKKTSSGAYDYTTIMSTGGGRCGNTTLNVPAKKNNVTLTTIPSYSMMCSYYTTINLPDFSQTPNLTIGNNAFYQNNLSQSNGFFYKVTNGSVDYSTLDSYGGLRGGELVIPEESHGVKLKTINASFAWSSFSKITIPSSVVTISGGNFPKSNANNTQLKTIVNKTGKAFNWYQLTGSTHTNPGPFVTGTVSHQSGNIQIVAN